MNSILLLILGFAISFAGSVPPGAVSLSLVQIGKANGWNTAVRWAFWASFIEVFQLALALYLHFQLQTIPKFELYARPLAAMLLLFLGIRLLLKTKPLEPGSILSFKAFIGLNIFNPMAIPFWLGALQLAMPSREFVFSFAAGSFLGAWLCLSLYGWVGSGLKGIPSISTHILNRSIGWSMVILSLWQSVLFLHSFITLSFPSSNQIFSRL